MITFTSTAGSTHCVTRQSAPVWFVHRSLDIMSGCMFVCLLSLSQTTATELNMARSELAKEDDTVSIRLHYMLNLAWLYSSVR